MWWDAIAAPWNVARLALAALDLHGQRSFALLNDPGHRVVYWLVPVGTTPHWDVPHTRAFGETQDLAFPVGSGGRPAGPQWLRLPRPNAWLTDPVLLQSALQAAVNTLYVEQPAPVARPPLVMACRLFGGAKPAADARRYVRDVLRGTVDDDLLDDTLLCLSELATNAVQHAHAERFLLKFWAGPELVRVECHDPASAWPRLRHPSTEETHGRGLLLVNEVTSRWGVTRRRFSRSKSVWFEIDNNAGTGPRSGVEWEGRSAC